MGGETSLRGRSSDNEKLYDSHVSRSRGESPHRPEPGGLPPRQTGTKTQMVQMQIEETKSHLNKTLKGLQQRGQKLEDLEETTAMLVETAGVFTTTAKETKNKMWWKDAKITIILIVTIIAILAAIIISKQDLKDYLSSGTISNIILIHGSLISDYHHYHHYHRIFRISSFKSSPVFGRNRWTLKEAAYKALYPHYRLTWKDIIVTKKDEKPHLFFLDSKKIGITTINAHVSVTHDGEYVISQVLLEN
ncbi:hypothetical protein G9A89_012947 [Geosiphon pyriformis]|nr:hypothetical protein G9A89_012947 [Geosiphon pyriformis]